MAHESPRNSIYSQPGVDGQPPPPLSTQQYPPPPAGTYSQFDPAYPHGSTPVGGGYPDPRYYQNPLSSPPPPNANPGGLPRYDGSQPPPPPPPSAGAFSPGGPIPGPYGVPGAAAPSQYDQELPHSQAAPKLYNAINHAFDTSSAANKLPDEVIAQITEQVRSQVIDSIRAEFTGREANRSAPGGYPPQQQQPQQQYQPPYPTQATGNVPTPPMPPPPSGGAGQYFSSGISGQQRHSSGPIDGSGGVGGFGPTRAVHTPPTPNRNSDSEDSPYFDAEDRKREAARSKAGGASKPKEQPIKEDLSSRYGERKREDASRERPGPTRAMTDEEETVVEKMWQPLFDDGLPTARLGQFLRGLALHLVEDFEPKQSLVVGPMKMKRFYDKMRISDEIYPWAAIFSLPHSQLSNLYSTLSCHHHLISPSASPFDPPTIPALTPLGFASWLTLFIQSHPNKEFDRLSITVRDWPISNADNRKERLPKELSRRLLPKRDSESAKRRIYDALFKAGIAINSSLPPPPQNPPPSSTSSTRSGAPQSAHQSFSAPPPGHSSSSSSSNQRDRDRGAYPPPPSHQSRHATVKDDIDEDDETDTSSDDEHHRHAVPIERQRKPYTAKEGAGKIHDDDLSRTRSHQGVPLTREATNLSATSSTYGGSVPSATTGASSSTVRGRDRAGSTAARGPPSVQSDTYAGSGREHTSRTARGKSPPFAPSQGYRSSGDLDPTTPAGYYSGSKNTRERQGDREGYDDDRYYSHSDRDRLSDRGREHHRDRDYQRESDRENFERERLRREREEEALESERRYQQYGDEYNRNNSPHGHSHTGYNNHSRPAPGERGYPPGGYGGAGLGTGERYYG